MLDEVLRERELVDTIIRILEIRREKKIRGESPVFDTDEVGSAWNLRKLALAGIVKIVDKVDGRVIYDLALPDEEIERKIKIKTETTPEPLKYSNVPPDLFDVIVGYDDIKWIIKKSLASGRVVHFLFVGAPGTAKSLFLFELERLRGSVFITMGTTTKVGLRDLIFNKLPRYLLIDEIDKLEDPDDVAVLLNWMEEGRVVICKHGKVAEERRGKGWVFATANRLDVLPYELRSRFMVFRFKPYSKDEYVRVVEQILIRREHVKPELARYIAQRLVNYTRDVRDAIKVARLADSFEDVDRIIEIWLKYQGSMS